MNEDKTRGYYEVISFEVSMFNFFIFSGDIFEFVENKYIKINK